VASTSLNKMRCEVFQTKFVKIKRTVDFLLYFVFKNFDMHGRKFLSKKKIMRHLRFPR